MRCPFCHVDNDRVIDSRASQEGYAIRRRRECLGCKRRYTTYENIEDLAIKQTKLLTQPQPCPSCQKLCEIQDHTRSLTTGGGTAEIHETVCHCSACRRDFFPSTHPAEAASTRL